MVSFIESTNEYIKNACEFLNLDEITTQTLLTPKREVTVHFNVRMDDGKMKRFTGFRVLHNNSLGYGKGGIRFHPEEDINTVRSLASLMTWKTSLAGLPLGGAKGGIICNPKEMSIGEIERLSRGYIRAIADFIGPKKDVLAPDVQTNPKIMSWFVDEFEIIKGCHQPGVVTGKPIILGGSNGRHNATAMGGMYVLREVLRDMGINSNNITVVIQGFGNVGSHAAKLIYDMFDAKIIGIGDINGAIQNNDGINPYELEKFMMETGSLIGYPNSLNISNDTLLTLPVDIVIPAAIENVITIDNANKVQAKIILELANGPITPKADKILYENGVYVIPDLLANSGGVTVSHLESVQNRQAWYWDETKINNILDKNITKMYHDVYNSSIQNRINMRKAAFIIAISRVIEAMKLRGQV